MQQVKTILLFLGFLHPIFKGALSFKFFGPRPDRLLDFWPLDERFGVNSIGANQGRLDEESKFVNKKALLAETEPGPFGKMETSYWILNEQPLAMYDFVPTYNITSFTVSAYVYLSDTSGDGIYSIVRFFENENESSGFFQLSYNGSSVKVESKPGSGVDVKLETSPGVAILVPEEWTFVAVTYDQTSKTAKIYGQTGILFATKNFSEDLIVPRQVELPRISMDKHRVACFQIYETVLTASEINRLRCVCQTAGKCQNGSPFNSTSIEVTSDPAWSSVVWYWRLDDQSGLEEVKSGRSPDVINAKPFVIGSLTGPFRNRRVLHSPAVEGNWVAEFNDVDVLPSFSEEFSITFFLFIPEGNLTNLNDSVLFLLMNHSFAVSGNRIVITDVSEDKILSLNLPVLKPLKEWNFLALTYQKDRESGIQLIYYNETGGEIAGTQNIEFLFDKSAEGHRIAFGPTTGNGALACFAIHDRALSPEEIPAVSRLCCGSSVDCPRLSQPDGIVRQGALLHYWPFDAESKFTDIKRGLMPEGLFNSQFGKGPFDVNDTALSCAQPIDYAIKELRDSFTLSTYLFFDSSFAITFENVDDSSTIIKVAVVDRYNISLSSSSTKEALVIPIEGFDVLPFNKWAFVALSYNAGFVWLHRSTGDIFAMKSWNFSANGIRKVRLQIEGDSSSKVACLSIHDRALSTTEIARLPCACKNRAKCWPNVAANVNMKPAFPENPEISSQIFIWPFNKVHGLLEASNGLMPSYISRMARLVIDKSDDQFGLSYYRREGYVDELAHYQLDSSLLLDSFDLHLHLFLDSSTQDEREAFGFYPATFSKQTVPILALRCSSDSCFLVSSNNAPIDGFNLTVRPNQWSLISISYGRDSRSETKLLGEGVIDKAKVLVNVSTTAATRRVSLRFGRLLGPDDRMACIILVNGSIPYNRQQLLPLCGPHKVSATSSGRSADFGCTLVSLVLLILNAICYFT